MSNIDSIIITTIESLYSNKSFIEAEMPTIMDEIIANIQKHHDDDIGKLTLAITPYLHYHSDTNTFKFDSKKKQTNVTNKSYPKFFVDTSTKNDIRFIISKKTSNDTPKKSISQKLLIDDVEITTPKKVSPKKAALPKLPSDIVQQLDNVQQLDDIQVTPKKVSPKKAALPKLPSDIVQQLDNVQQLDDIQVTPKKVSSKKAALPKLPSDNVQQLDDAQQLDDVQVIPKKVSSKKAASPKLQSDDVQQLDDVQVIPKKVSSKKAASPKLPPDNAQQLDDVQVTPKKTLSKKAASPKLQSNDVQQPDDIQIVPKKSSSKKLPNDTLKKSTQKLQIDDVQLHKNSVNAYVETIKLIVKDEPKYPQHKLIKSAQLYKFPTQNKFNLVKRTQFEFEPFGSDWVHDVQVDDVNISQINLNKFNILRAIKSPEQRSPEWFALRKDRITASDGASSMDCGGYGAQYEFILKKVTTAPFNGNIYTHHGVKYEDIATMIYEYRMNVSTEEFGLLKHPNCDFLGASPDRICSPYKLNRINKSKFVGRMLEIKCPYKREIKKTGQIVDGICPYHYWIQVQLQLECCDLDECDFLQCEIREYKSRDEFINDTDINEPFRSKQTGFEKGCVIQLLKKDKMSDVMKGNYTDVMVSHSKYIYPPKVDMSPLDCDIWVNKCLNELYKYKDYYFDKVIYWKLTDSACTLIERDKVWYEKCFPLLKEVWGCVEYLRSDKRALDIFVNYVSTRSIKRNKDIMGVIRKLCMPQSELYVQWLDDIQKEIDKNKVVVDDENGDVDDIDMDTDNGIYEMDYPFVDEVPVKPKKVVKKARAKKIIKEPESEKTSPVVGDQDIDMDTDNGIYEMDYPFIDDVSVKPNIVKKVRTKNTVKEPTKSVCDDPDYMFI